MRLNRELIVAAAFDLLQEVGLDGLTTRSLAARLGISGPSLYWHFKSKQDLLDEMARVLLRRALPGPDLTSDEFDWKTWLEAGARGLREVALSTPDGARILGMARPRDPDYLAALQAMVRTLERTGLSEGECRLTLRCLARWAISSVLLEDAGPTAQGPSDAAFEHGLSLMITGLEARLETIPRPRQAQQS